MAGEDLPTGNPFDGLLERFGWYGRRFDGPDHGHPLVFIASPGRAMSLNPAFVPIAALIRYPWLVRAPFVPCLQGRQRQVRGAMDLRGLQMPFMFVLRREPMEASDSVQRGRTPRSSARVKGRPGRVKARPDRRTPPRTTPAGHENIPGQPSDGIRVRDRSNATTNSSPTREA
jgi:GXWXG protein